MSCDLLDFKPQWTSQQKVQPLNRNELINLGYSAPQMDKSRGRNYENLMTFKFVYEFFNDTDIDEFVEFYLSKFGNALSFCLSSWQSDIVLSSAATSGDTVLNVHDTEHNLVANQKLLFHIYNGSEYYFNRTVSSATATTVTLSQSIPVDLPVGTTISIIYRVRFADSNLELDHNSNDKTRITVNFIEDYRDSDTYS